MPNRFGEANSAYTLNGVNQNLLIPYDSRLYSDEFTLSLWVNFQRLGGTLWRAGNASADGWHGFDIEFYSGVLGYQDYTGTGYNASIGIPQTNILLDQWQNVVVSRSSNACAMYLDGVKIASQTNLIPYAKLQGGTPMSIGANNADPSGFFGTARQCWTRFTSTIVR